MAKQRTLCWSCQNFSKCSWSKGIPVDGWKATKTIIYNAYGNVYAPIESYCVHECPQYVEDEILEIGLIDIAKILELSQMQALRLSRNRPKELKARMLLKGYEFVDHDKRDKYFTYKRLKK